MATRLFVGNLPETTKDNELHAAFSNFGEITNLELKSKSATDNESKKFAFVSLSASNYNIESCIKHFSIEDFNGNRLYVTRARESFLERLQRERAEAQQKAVEKNLPQEAPKTIPAIKLGEKLNPRKRKFENETNHKVNIQAKPFESNNHVKHNGEAFESKKNVVKEFDKKKHDSEQKRMEAMKKKRLEFKEKQMIVKSGLTSVDKVPNKKVIFSDNEEEIKQVNGHDKTSKTKNTLFNEDDENDSGDELNFEIKKQFEGKQGQKVLDLQSRYKSDKRFVLDERFIENEQENENDLANGEDQIEVTREDEKAKQLDILQNVLGIAIKRKIPDEDKDGKKNKPKIGMLRFDPSQPDHAKFLAPIDTKETTKKSKKKKDKQAEETPVEEQKPEPPRPEVSKEQFYKVSETLKEAIAQPTAFSLRSLFGNNVVAEEPKEDVNYTPLEAPKKTKIKNPLDPGEKNPFVYDSSDSETEVEKETATESVPATTESKAVWRESLFFGLSDQRLKDGLDFFNDVNESVQKERRELKFLMKKRMHNNERKNQMFQKKIGGRKKTMKKSFRKKS